MSYNIFFEATNTIQLLESWNWPSFLIKFEKKIIIRLVKTVVIFSNLKTRSHKFQKAEMETVWTRGRHNFWKTWSDRTSSDRRFLKPNRIELDRIEDFENLIWSKLIGSKIFKTWSDQTFQKPDRIEDFKNLIGSDRKKVDPIKFLSI